MFGRGFGDETGIEDLISVVVYDNPMRVVI
jgi:hypothetical protein